MDNFIVSQDLLQEIITERAGSSLLKIQKMCKNYASAFRMFVYETAVSGFVEITEAQTHHSESFTEEELIVKFIDIFRVTRGDQTICLYSFGAPDPQTEYKIQHYCNYIPFIYNRRVANRVLQNLHEPVDFEDQKQFFSDLCEIAQKCSGMEFGAFRRLEGKRLKCVFAWTIDGIVDESGIDKRSCEINDNKYFYDAIKSHELQICDDLQKKLPEFSQTVGQDSVVTFCAIPVVVGEKCIGIFSIAQKVKYDFSWAERQGFSTIANAIGVSISNFDNYHQSMSIARQKEKEEALMTAVGVVQGVRHHLKAQAELLSSNVIRLRARKKIDNKFDEITTLIDDISLDISESLNRMKSIMDFEKKIEEVNLDDIINEVYMVHHYKIQDMKISYSYKNKSKHNLDCNFITVPTIIRSTLHHLFLNTLDALERISPRRRLINIEATYLDSERVIIEFMDSGPGLDKTAVMAAIDEKFDGNTEEIQHYIEVSGKGVERKAAYEWLFREGFTSKPEGSGHGLSLSRQHVKQVGGSLEGFDPYQSGNNIGFRISFPISADSIFKANQNGKLVIDQAAEFYSRYEEEILQAYFDYGDKVKLEMRNSSLK